MARHLYRFPDALTLETVGWDAVSVRPVRIDELLKNVALGALAGIGGAGFAAGSLREITGRRMPTPRRASKRTLVRSKPTASLRSLDISSNFFGRKSSAPASSASSVA